MNEAQLRPFHIRIDRELTHTQVIALLEEHLASIRAESPPECVFALDLDGLRRPEITFLTAWRRAPGAPPGAKTEDVGELLAMGALKELAPTTATEGGHGELKSMRTSARHLRQGAAQAILTELLAIARHRCYARVSLETGSTPTFEPVMAMYQRFGFVACGPFADYRDDPFSRFMTTDQEHMHEEMKIYCKTKQAPTHPKLELIKNSTRRHSRFEFPHDIKTQA